MTTTLPKSGDWKNNNKKLYGKSLGIIKVDSKLMLLNKGITIILPKRSKQGRFRKKTNPKLHKRTKDII